MQSRAVVEFNPKGFNTKMRSPDRVLMLRPAEGKTALSSKGMLDNRLFKGENKLHAIMDTQTCLWSLKYEIGGLEAPLKQQWTSFNQLMKYLREYFNRRNVEITEVVDQ